MGQHQLWLLVFGILILGAAIALGILMFSDNASTTNRDGITNDLSSLATKAQQYYRKPHTWGGGQNSFAGLSPAHLAAKLTNANGKYEVLYVSETEVVLKGTGREKGTDGQNITAMMTVTSDAIKLEFLN